jgi:hypothetical protein
MSFEYSGLESLNSLHQDLRYDSPSNLEIRNCTLNLANQNVIRVDTERTFLVPKEF